MEKIIPSLLLVLLSFSVFGCNHNSDDSFSSINPIEGGPDSKVVGLYSFSSHEEYLNFYELFKDYNSQRYWAPINSDDFEVFYFFRTEGINLKDFNAKRYDLIFQGQNMFVSLKNDFLQFYLSLDFLTNIDFGDDIDLYSDVNFDDYNKEYDVSLFLNSNDFCIATGILKAQDYDNDLIENNLKESVSLFNGGFGNVF